jgi:hypothetical protein
MSTGTFRTLGIKNSMAIGKAVATLTPGGSATIWESPGSLFYKLQLLSTGVQSRIFVIIQSL